MDIREVYVQSCGLAQEHDYCWVKLTQKGEHIREIPTILQEAHDKNKGRLTDQYDSHDPSIILAEHGQEILLLVTALKANERTEIYRRQVRNSVAIVTSRKDKPVLEKILNHIRCNWEDFRAKIDHAVTFDNDQNCYGFKVNRQGLIDYFEQIKKLIEEIENQKTPNSKKPDPSIKVVEWPPRKQPAEKKILVLLLVLLLVVLLVITVVSIQQPQPKTLPQPTIPTEELQEKQTTQPLTIPETIQEDQIPTPTPEEQLVTSSIE